MSMESPYKIETMKILTNHSGQKESPTWGLVSTYLNPRRNDLLSDFKLAFLLYTMRKNYDCVVLGAGRSDIIFALMQSLLPFRKISTVMIDCLWDKNPNFLRYKFNKLFFRLSINQSTGS